MLLCLGQCALALRLLYRVLRLVPQVKQVPTACLQESGPAVVSDEVSDLPIALVDRKLHSCKLHWIGRLPGRSHSVQKPDAQPAEVRPLASRKKLAISRERRRAWCSLPCRHLAKRARSRASQAHASSPVSESRARLRAAVGEDFCFQLAANAAAALGLSPTSAAAVPGCKSCSHVEPCFAWLALEPPPMPRPTRKARR